MHFVSLELFLFFCQGGFLFDSFRLTAFSLPVKVHLSRLWNAESFSYYYWTIIPEAGRLLANFGLGLRCSGTEGFTWEPGQPVEQNKM